MQSFDNNRPDDGAWHDLASRSQLMKTGFNRHLQMFMDKSTPYVAPRWIVSSIMLLLFLARVVFSGGWYVICYALGIYYLSLFVDFISPRMDPEFRATQEELDVDSGPSLPTKANEEFKPFVRRLPEFKFWYMATKATLLSLVLSMFDMFDLPVFWPILLLYFIILLVLTLRKQINHMSRHGYVPWNRGKRRYDQG